MEHISEKEFLEKNLKEVVRKEGPLKNLLIEYVGDRKRPEDNNVTVEMIVEVLADEFPEFLLAIAEENWVRGYQQALTDVDTGRSIEESHDKQEQDNRLHETAE
tara:strand:+ start:10155 stop:10466 length:312 start_codon:yes stop_codon:yes gene_type:complete